MKNLFITMWVVTILSGCSPKIASSFTSTPDSLTKDVAVTSTHPDYAAIYFYRKPGGMGTIVYYDVHIEDTKVYRSRPNTKAEVKLYEEGDVKVWAKTESKDVIPINIKKGRDYYIRTSVSAGLIIGRPRMEIVSAETGKEEYESIKGK